MPEGRAVGAVAHQAASSNEPAIEINCRNLVVGCQCHNFIEIAERSVTEYERPGPSLNKGRECGLKVAIATAFHDYDL